MLEGPYSYSYPTHKTGTAQDLMSVVTRAYEIHLERTKTVLPAKSDWQRTFLEPPFILLGLTVSKTLAVLPSETVKAFHSKLFDALASPHRYEFDAASQAVQSARKLCAQLEAETGKAPALLSLISHPPVLGDLAHLNFAWVRHAMLARREARGRPCRPRLLVATDFFALDSIPSFQEGIYAGFMGDYHLGFDRIIFSRKPLSRWLLAKTGWDRTPMRLLKILAEGREVGLVLAGGVPGTTRILYAVREWLGRQRLLSPLRANPAEISRRLKADESFRRFSAEAPLGARLSVNASRMAEAWAMSSLAGVFMGDDAAGKSGADSGTLTPAARDCALRCLSAFGLPASGNETALAELSAEIERETPYRARFFNILASRVLGKGRPVVFIPVAHRLKPKLAVSVGRAWAWKSGNAKSVSAVTPKGVWEGSPAEFASVFGKENFE
jgi:hypothetical protein